MNYARQLEQKRRLIEDLRMQRDTNDINFRYAKEKVKELETQ